MDARSLTGRIVRMLAALLLFALSGALAWVAVNDYQVRVFVPKGVTLVGHDLTGMDETQVRGTIESVVAEPMLRSVTVTGDRKTWTLESKDFVSIDEESMVKEAYSTRVAATILARVDSELRGTPLPVDVKPEYSVDTSGIASWVVQTAAKLDRPPRNSTRTLKGYAFNITPSIVGAKVNQATAVKQIANALSADTALASPDRTVALSVAPVKPAITPASFKTAIIVSLSECRIRLYNGAKLVKSYSCAPGRPSWPTPTGDFKIISKLKDEPWYNPHSSWSAGMPEVIAGGPYNPMGDTKIGIDYPGVFMHAVPPSEFDSIGSHESHGCMRMMPSAVHDLYTRVEIGDPVFIRD
jgi:lipoprotein-anchoring transpeptidase ErfK/SrfK